MNRKQAIIGSIFLSYGEGFLQTASVRYSTARMIDNYDILLNLSVLAWAIGYGVFIYGKKYRLEMSYYDDYRDLVALAKLKNLSLS